jgi:hypothetical protein
LPSSYDFDLYGRAVLYPKGMTDCWSLADLLMCGRCHSALVCKCPRQPVNSLANFQYYGHEKLPHEIRDALARASAYDLMLIARARASQITHFYAHKPSGWQHWLGEEGSQRYNKGNIAIRPQDSTHLRTLLPPCHDELRDAMCVIFSGHDQKPTRETVKQMRPVLVTKSIVKTLIDFLLANNPWYQQCGVAYSQTNMDALFDENDGDVDTSLPRALEICHLSRDSVRSDENAMTLIDPQDDVEPSEADAGDMVMEAVGFTKGDHSSASKEKMKLHALAHVLDRNRFLLSQAGSRYVADNDPGLMSFLFPHLDPWDIGGFNHTGRTSQQHISIEAQVKNLLRQDDSPFRKDPNFAFICWNMIQKKEVSSNTTFQISSALQRNLAEELTIIAPSLTTLAEKWTHSPTAKPSTTQEKQAAQILRWLHASTKSLKGSAGYKLCRRNEIRALMKRFGTPAFFVTVNPHDLMSSMIPVMTEIDDAEWASMSSFARAKVIASRPDATAIAFFFNSIFMSYGE